MLNRALKEATKSSYHHKLGSVIFKGNRVLSVGHNQVNRGTSRCKTKWDGSLHAEQAAILKLLTPATKSTLEGASIFVTRLRKSGLIGLAKPCETCMELIKLVGLKEVLYTTNEGMIEKVKL